MSTPTSLSVEVHCADGKIINQRPLRIFTKGVNKGKFAVIYKGKAMLVASVGGNIVTADRQAKRELKASVRAAKMVDIGITLKPKSKKPAAETETELLARYEANLATKTVAVASPV